MFIFLAVASLVSGSPLQNACSPTTSFLEFATCFDSFRNSFSAISKNSWKKFGIESGNKEKATEIPATEQDTFPPIFHEKMVQEFQSELFNWVHPDFGIVEQARALGILPGNLSSEKSPINFNSKAILITCGNKHFKFAVFLIRSLKLYYKTEIPIVVGYLRKDLSERRIQFLANLNVTLLDMAYYINDSK